MSVTEFAMVEELAFLVRDNLRCKHLVLSMEEVLVNFLEDNSANGILELEPMDPYSRLLLHRLADIFGFAHVSVGEGDDRHLILERCPETSVPSILVSDILFQHDDESEPITTSHQLLRRNDAPPILKAKSPSFLTLEEREAAYLVARERIFSLDVGEIREPQKQKPRNVPVVAQRMIAHALGQKINPWNQDVRNCKEYGVQTTELNVQDKDKIDFSSTLEDFKGIVIQPRKNINLHGKAKSNNHDSNVSLPTQTNLPYEPAGKNSTNISISHEEASRNRAKEYSKEEHVGAAKRMFAHALGLQSARGSLGRCRATKQVDKE